jgi:plastocyanin
MRTLLLVGLLLPASLSAQTLWNVDVGGSTLNPLNLPYYNPQHLTINVGDQVRWSNSSGTHNVNGSLSLFPGNPEGFSSGDPASGSWNFTKTFTIPGVYNYHCTSQGHAATQFGSITVVNPSTGLADVEEASSAIRVYPSPANDRLFVDAGDLPLRLVRIIDLNGRELLSAPVQRVPMALEVESLPSGNYFVLLSDTDGRIAARPFRKE